MESDASRIAKLLMQMRRASSPRSSSLMCGSTLSTTSATAGGLMIGNRAATITRTALANSVSMRVEVPSSLAASSLAALPAFGELRHCARETTREIRQRDRTRWLTGESRKRRRENQRAFGQERTEPHADQHA